MAIRRKLKLRESDKLLLVSVQTQHHLFRARSDSTGGMGSERKIHWKHFSYLIAISAAKRMGLEPYKYVVADMLNVTTPAVKRNVRQMEELELALMPDKKNGAIKLTAYGQSIADKYWRIQLEHTQEAWKKLKENFNKQL